MKKKKIIFVIIFVFLIIFSIYFYFFSGHFYVKNTFFLGQSGFKDSEILNLSKIDTKKNIYFVNLNEAKKNLLKNPYIEDVVINRKFPDTLTFSIKQRVEVASMPFSSGYIVIDAKGIVLKILQGQENIKKPLINGIEIDNVKIGEEVHFKKKEKFQDFLKIIESASTIDLLVNISFIDIEDFDSIKMSTNTGIDILAGDMKDLSYKLKLLNKILIDLQSKGITKGTVDMRFKTDPIFRPNVTGEFVLNQYKKADLDKKTDEKKLNDKKVEKNQNLSNEKN